MAETTGIQWTNATWNPVYGCHKVSPGCKNCYMFREQRMYGRDPDTVVRSKTKFNEPLKWKEPRRIFTCSWSDWFIEEADEHREAMWDVIRRTPQHTYQILTKRIERAADHLPPDWPLKNVWLGVSVENQKYADLRIPKLLELPAAVHFISAEPLLGQIDISPWLCPAVNSCQQPFTPELAQVVRAAVKREPYNRNLIDWVIAGGESGPGARPTHPDWLRSLRDQCFAFGVPFFFKQWGEWAPAQMDPSHRETTTSVGEGEDIYFMSRIGKKAAGALLDGCEWLQFPEVRS